MHPVKKPLIAFVTLAAIGTTLIIFSKIPLRKSVFSCKTAVNQQYVSENKAFEFKLKQFFNVRADDFVSGRDGKRENNLKNFFSNKGWTEYQTYVSLAKDIILSKADRASVIEIVNGSQEYTEEPGGLEKFSAKGCAFYATDNSDVYISPDPWKIQIYFSNSNTNNTLPFLIEKWDVTPERAGKNPFRGQD